MLNFINTFYQTCGSQIEDLKWENRIQKKTVGISPNFCRNTVKEVGHLLHYQNYIRRQ